VTDRYIEAEVAVNANVVQRRRVLLSDAGDTPTTTAAGVGLVPAALAQSGQVVATEYGNGVVHQTVLTLAALAQTVVNGTEYQGTKIYSFPEGRILVLGVTASLAPTTTSAIASTLNSGVTGAVAVGTAAASNVSLTSTMVDLLPSTAFVTSTVINEPAAAVGAALAASAHFDGHSSHKDVYLNSAFATTTDVDADATMTWAGNITITWVYLGDY
jgi:hypothetical protein